MKIQQIVYTKINDGESPRGKSDFHTVFYPINILTELDVSELEQKIHVQNLQRMSGKKVIFFQKIKKEYYMVLLYFTNLPDEKDSFGRQGIFMVHGFLFPRALWQQSLSPMELSELVREHVFTSRNKLLSSDIIDKTSGDIRPLKVTEKQLCIISENHRPHLIVEKNVCQLLINMATGASVELLIRGTAEQVFNYMCNIITVVPDDLKIRIGWDSLYENGNLFFFPLKVAGFNNERPKAKNPVVIDAATGIIIEQPEDCDVFKAETPFQLWLAGCDIHNTTKATVEELYKLSLLLDKGIPFEGTVPANEISCFTKVNKEKICTVFIAGCAPFLGDKIPSLIVQQLSQDVMLDLILTGLPFQHLAEHVVRAVYTFSISPKQAGIQLPEQMLTPDFPELLLLDRVWQGGQFTSDDLKALHPDQSLALIRYLLKGEWTDITWLVDIMLNSYVLRKWLLQSSDTIEEKKILLIRFYKRQKIAGEIAELLARETIKQHKIFHLLRDDIQVTDIVEDALKDNHFDNGELKLLATWLSKKELPLHNKPFISSLLVEEKSGSLLTKFKSYFAANLNRRRK